MTKLPLGMQVNIHEAKTHFSRLIERISLGEDVIIMKSGTPVARLVPVEKFPHRRSLGWAAGEFVVPEDFDAPLPSDVETSFYR
ncbi:MAG: type II toxin-antitoxin system Phd/YefM family antitoxin [Chloroflexota bacterium]|nr:type II toxin-antitoxin system Phd/YefM family antitoxin [Chloroflexota bacterium]